MQRVSEWWLIRVSATGEDKAAVPVTDTEFSQSVNPQNFCTGVALHHQALIQNSGPLIDMSDIRPGTSESVLCFMLLKPDLPGH